MHFRRLHEMGPMIRQGHSQEQLANLAFTFTGSAIGEYLEVYPDCEYRQKMDKLHNDLNNEQYNHLDDLPSIMEYLRKRGYEYHDGEAMILHAGFKTMIGEIDIARENLRRGLICLLRNGRSQEKFLTYFVMVGNAIDFESWIRQSDGLFITG